MPLLRLKLPEVRELSTRETESKEGKVMNNYSYDNKQGNRNRSSWLVLEKEGTLHKFAGSSIPDVLAIVGEQYRKDGKWSHSTYQLVLGTGVRVAFDGHADWKTGRISDAIGASSWSELAKRLEVSVEETRRFAAEYWPGTAETLDQREADLKALES